MDGGKRTGYHAHTDVFHHTDTNITLRDVGMTIRHYCRELAMKSCPKGQTRTGKNRHSREAHAI